MKGTKSEELAVRLRMSVSTTRVYRAAEQFSRTEKWLFSKFVCISCLSEGSRLPVIVRMQPLLLSSAHTTVTSKRLPPVITVGQPGVSQLTSIISLAAPFIPLCPFSHTPFIRSLCLLLFKTNLFITLQLRLIYSGKLGPSTFLSLCLGSARVSWVRGQKEEGEGGSGRAGERRWER